MSIEILSVEILLRGICKVGLGIRDQGPGIWDQRSGIEDQGFEIRNLGLLLGVRVCNLKWDQACCLHSYNSSERIEPMCVYNGGRRGEPLHGCDGRFSAGSRMWA